MLILNANENIQLIYLNNALYIPDFPINIISGQKHYESGGLIKGNELLDKYNRTITKFNNNTFLLNLNIKEISLLASKIINNTNLTIIWYYKFGYPSYDALIRTAKSTIGIPINKLKEKDLYCEACKIVKNIRKQLKISQSRAEHPLKRICIDFI